jgi:hypothetical protein
MRPLARRILGFLVVVACLVAPALAYAQSVTVNSFVRRYDPSGKEVQPRATGLNPTGINFDDCYNDLQLEFGFTQTGITASTVQRFEVWVGTGACTADVDRGESGTNQRCWKVYDIGNGPSQTGSIRVPVRRIVSETKTQGIPTPGAEICSQGSTGVRSYSVQFLPIGSDRAVKGTGATYPINAKLFGPAAVGNVSANGGDMLLTAKWTVPSDTTILGFKVYCDPPRGQEDTMPRGSAPVADAQAEAATRKVLVCPDAGTPDASADADPDADPDAAATADAGCYEVTETIDSGSSGGGSGAACSSAVLVPKSSTSTSSGEGGTQNVGPPTVIDPVYLCGETTGATASSANVANLRNNTSYAIAVAAYDSYGNAGLLAGPTCGTPEQTDDFWDRYRAAGGGAGGSFCALDGPGLPASTAAVWLAGVGLAMVIVRRRRRR